MKNTRERIRSLVYAAIDELNEQYADEDRLEKTPETILLGNAGQLDSVGFVNLMVLVEERCQDAFGLSISISDSLGTWDANPLTTVGEFVDYLCHVVKEEMPN